MAEDIKVIITAEDKASGVFNKIKDSTSGLGSTLGSVAKIAGVGLVAAMGALTGVAISSVKAFDDQDKAIKQLEAVLQSTKSAAGLTKQEMLDMASSFQKVTTYADETVLSAQNVLLTFTGIKGPIVKDATQAVLDMSTALGQDLQSSAIQVGKALQDPILGVTALRRVGVNFNETQIEMIKGMVESGKTMEAQKFILQELSTEFGGSASKAAETFGGKMLQLQNAVGELQETIGSALIEAIMPFITQLTEWAQKPETQDKITAIAKAIAEMVKQLAPVIAQVLPVFFKLLQDIVLIFGEWWSWMNKAAEALGTVIFKIMTFIDWIKGAIDWVGQLIEKIKELWREMAANPIQTFNKGVDKVLGAPSRALGLPGFATGGIVPGPIGAPMAAIVHGGETVVPAGMGGGIVVNISGNSFLDDDAPSKMADSIINALKMELKI